MSSARKHKRRQVCNKYLGFTVSREMADFLDQMPEEKRNSYVVQLLRKYLKELAK